MALYTTVRSTTSNSSNGDLHEQLYMNIYLLTMDHPTDKTLLDLLQKDMFARCNKAAFQHIIYFLLKILNPLKIQSKIPSWPIYELKLETQFRNEVTNYLKEIHETYENVQFSIPQKSHLVSPGGDRFARFILEFSQFVLIQVTKKLSNKPVILKPKYTAGNTHVHEAVLQKFENLTKKNNSEASKTLAEIQKLHQNNKNIALEINDKLNKLEEEKQELDNSNSELPDDIDEILGKIEERLERTKEIANNFQSIKSLLENCNNIISVCVTNEFKLNNENKEDVNIITTLQNFQQILQQAYLKYDTFQIDSRNYHKVVLEKLEKTEKLLSKSNEVKKRLQNVYNIL